MNTAGSPDDLLLNDMLLILINLAATLFMTGVIWFVQVVHYPLFSGVGSADFVAYEAAHSTRTTLVVAPPMLIELGSAALLIVRAPLGAPAWQTWLGMGLVVLIWLSTFLLQVPRHTALGGGFDAAAHRALVGTNWLRTAAWSIRSLLMLWIAAECLSHHSI